MGAVCSCFRAETMAEYMNPNSSAYRNCLCLGCFIQNFLYLYMSLFRRGEVHPLPSSFQTAASMASSGSPDTSLSDMYRPPPRPLPYDADTRYLRLQRDSLVSRREKGSSQSRDEAEPLRGDDELDSESLCSGSKWSKSNCEEGSKEKLSKSSLKISPKTMAEFEDMYTSSDDEDTCPTCFEEYTPENPKIVTECSHHYHLSCIYEWMERSESCPICGKVMAFDETP